MECISVDFTECKTVPLEELTSDYTDNSLTDKIIRGIVDGGWAHRTEAETQL